MEGGRGMEGKNQDQFSEQRKDWRKKNPIGKYGNVTRCVLCRSLSHWARECPRNIQNKGPSDNQVKEERSYYGCETNEDEDFGDIEAILDTGCNSTVIGEL